MFLQAMQAMPLSGRLSQNNYGDYLVENIHDYLCFSSSSILGWCFQFLVQSGWARISFYLWQIVLFMTFHWWSKNNWRWNSEQCSWLLLFQRSSTVIWRLHSFLQSLMSLCKVTSSTSLKRWNPHIYQVVLIISFDRLSRNDCENEPQVNVHDPLC